MPFLRSAARPQPVECFFCLSPSLLPPSDTSSSASSWNGKGKGKLRESADVRTRWNWQCAKCGCWNVRDASGEIKSDFAAMYNPTLNSQSFSLRATHSTSHIQSSKHVSPFCRNCLGNQMLIMNMLANYLPEDDHPSYRALYDELPEYLSSLHSRYPPVCADCQPGVDKILRKSDQKAQTAAWGSALQRGAERSSSSGGRYNDEGRIGPGSIGWAEVLVWRLRGAAFYLSALISWATAILRVTHRESVAKLVQSRYGGRSIGLWISVFHVSSFLWMAWDPWWLRRMKGRGAVRMSGRWIWKRNMAMVYILRCVSNLTSLRWSLASKSEISRSDALIAGITLIVEVLLFINALISIRVSGPLAVQLVRPVAVHSSQISPTSGSPAIDSSLIAGRVPISTVPDYTNTEVPQNPIFGQASLRGHGGLPAQQLTDDMDWEPTPSPSFIPRRPPGLDDDELDTTHRPDWDAFATNKQRMFPPQRTQDETGLESLLAGWGLGQSSTSGVSERTTLNDRFRTPETGHFARVFHSSSERTSRGLELDLRAIRLLSLALAIGRLVGLGLLSVSALRHIPWVRSMDPPLHAIEIASSMLAGVLYTSSGIDRQQISARLLLLSIEVFLKANTLYSTPNVPGRFAERLSLYDTTSSPWAWGLWGMFDLSRLL